MGMPHSGACCGAPPRRSLPRCRALTGAGCHWGATVAAFLIRVRWGGLRVWIFGAPSSAAARGARFRAAGSGSDTRIFSPPKDCERLRGTLESGDQRGTQPEVFTRSGPWFRLICFVELLQSSSSTCGVLRASAAREFPANRCSGRLGHSARHASISTSIRSWICARSSSASPRIRRDWSWS
jgi:hypothetical protein